MKITKFFALLLSAVMAATAAVPAFADEVESSVITDISEGDDTASANETETFGDTTLADEPSTEPGGEDNKEADTVTLSLVNVTPTEQPEEITTLADDVSLLTYAIKLTADGEGKEIVDYQSAEITFNITGRYNITDSDDKALTKNTDGKYTFNKNSGVEVVTDHSIIIGYINITGYEPYLIKITGATINIGTPPGKQYEFGSTLKLQGEEGDEVIDNTVASGSVTPPKANITINVMFPNKLADTIKCNDMEVTVNSLYDSSGAERFSSTIDLSDVEKSPEPTPNGVTKIEKKEFKYNNTGEVETVEPAAAATGNANGYCITMELPVPEGRQYAFGITGQGYRSYAVSTDIANGTVINIWNNVMDGEGMPVVTKETGETKKENITFLAGDIVGSKKIDLYDLSAVISYFGTTVTNENQKQYLKYDLNRDGTIDSRDIAMVLVSWGK